MRVKVPRLVVAGLSGDSGKTLVSLGLLASWRSKGKRLSVFKKGPDYIDPLWLVQPPRVRLLPEPPCRSCARVGLPVGGSQPFDRYVRVPLGGGDRGVTQQLGDGA